MKTPEVTVITVCFNAAEALSKTIANVANQHLEHLESLEYLVIDGKSTDNSLELIKENQKYISKWISEPDEGIYDAMNKGIRMAKGEYVLFMNAGDTFAHKKVLGNIFQKIAKQNLYPDLIYGDYYVVNEGYTELVRAESLDTAWRGMKFCHQSMLLKTSLAKVHLFSGKYITSDFEQVYDLYRKGISFYYYPHPISYFQNDGLNTKHKIRVRFEAKEIVNQYDTSWKTNFGFWQLIIWTYVVETVRKTLPKPWFETISTWKIKLLGGRKQVKNN